MNDRLPPLTALRAFEAASRHMSFALAAEELNVTPAALSFQIKSLEEHLGAQVFRRLNRAVELTEEGKALAPGVADGFEALHAAWRSVQRRLNSATLTVTAGPGFTAKWLAPRLYSFAQSHPDIELRFSAGLKIADFARDDVDVAVRFGQGDDEGLFSQPVIHEWVAPMMVPELAARVKTVEDLRSLVLLRDENSLFLEPKIDWPAYFEHAGVAGPKAYGPSFSQADHVVDAALSGAGAILGRISLTDGHLRERRLVMPLKQGLDARADYRIVCPRGVETRPQVARFIEWVQDQTECIEEFGRDIVFMNGNKARRG